ncbi:amidase [Devosia sp. 2618]|uniref:amidase n=1 Tax=Devosia sp. 2618 TaxID=3156454 RepID=UPI00339A935F
MTVPLHYLSLTELASKLATGEVSAVEVTQHALDRIAALADRTNAFITVTSDLALEAAARADALRASGATLPPLHGIPITLKDIFDVEGVATTAGMPIRRTHIADGNSTIVTRLQNAGAIILGKVNVAEGVFGQYLPPYGHPINPWNRQYWGGASSGGSGVATAAGLGYGSIASDTGGSIRMPSAVNRVTGLKPTWGRVSRHRVFELAGSLDHVGVMARSAEDIAVLLGVIAGEDSADPTSLLAPVQDYVAELSVPRKLKIGMPRNWLANGVDADVLAALESTVETFRTLGAEIVDIELPPDEDLVQHWYEICTAQVALVHETSHRLHGSTYSLPLSTAIEHGRSMPASTLQRAYTYRQNFAGALDRILQQVDLIAVPAMPCAPPKFTEVEAMDNDTMFALHRFTSPFSMSGVPTVTFPCGTTRDGLPYAAQLVAARLDEPSVLAAVHAFQQATAFHRSHPDL